jgi:hypothetical protein
MEAIGLSLHAMQLVADKHLCSVAVSCLLCPCMLRALHLLQIGLVSQEPLLFSGSVLSNIMYGKPDATMAEVRV